MPLNSQPNCKIFQSEWTHQLSTIERTLNFFEEYFLWSTQQLDLLETDAANGGSPDCLKFYLAEAPMVLEEARETMLLLLALYKKKTLSEVSL